MEQDVQFASEEEGLRGVSRQRIPSPYHPPNTQCPYPFHVVSVFKIRRREAT